MTHLNYRASGAVFKVRRPIHLFGSVFGGREVVGLWTLKMVDLVSTQYFLTQLQLIYLFCKIVSQTRKELVKKM